MKKSDLKFGQMIVRRDGLRQLYIQSKDECQLVSPSGTCGGLSRFNEELEDTIFGYDIMEVFECQDSSICHLLTSFEQVEWTKIWSRNEVEEITADEAMRRLEETSGKKIKIIR